MRCAVDSPAWFLCGLTLTEESDSFGSLKQPEKTLVKKMLKTLSYVYFFHIHEAYVLNI